MKKGERTRERIVEAAAALLERQGAVGTGINQILEESGAPRGSLYFHFPGGKEELTCAALSMAAERWRGLLMACMTPAKTPGDAVQLACRALGARLKGSGYTLGCPIATTTLEVAAEDEAVRQVCAEHFGAWEQFLAEAFTERGVPAADAPGWASHVLAAIEGALLLGRAHRSTAPLKKTGELLARQLDAAAGLAAAAGPPALGR